MQNTGPTIPDDVFNIIISYMGETTLPELLSFLKKENNSVHKIKLLKAVIALWKEKKTFSDILETEILFNNIELPFVLSLVANNEIEAFITAWKSTSKSDEFNHQFKASLLHNEKLLNAFLYTNKQTISFLVDFIIQEPLLKHTLEQVLESKNFALLLGLRFSNPQVFDVLLKNTKELSGFFDAISTFQSESEQTRKNFHDAIVTELTSKEDTNNQTPYLKQKPCEFQVLQFGSISPDKCTGYGDIHLAILVEDEQYSKDTFFKHIVKILEKITNNTSWTIEANNLQKLRELDPTVVNTAENIIGHPTYTAQNCFEHYPMAQAVTIYDSTTNFPQKNPRLIKMLISIYNKFNEPGVLYAELSRIKNEINSNLFNKENCINPRLLRSNFINFLHYWALAKANSDPFIQDQLRHGTSENIIDLLHNRRLLKEVPYTLISTIYHRLLRMDKDLHKSMRYRLRSMNQVQSPNRTATKQEISTLDYEWLLKVSTLFANIVEKLEPKSIIQNPATQQTPPAPEPETLTTANPPTHESRRSVETHIPANTENPVTHEHRRSHARPVISFEAVLLAVLGCGLILASPPLATLTGLSATIITVLGIMSIVSAIVLAIIPYLYPKTQPASPEGGTDSFLRREENGSPSNPSQSFDNSQVNPLPMNYQNDQRDQRDQRDQNDQSDQRSNVDEKENNRNP